MRAHRFADRAREVDALAAKEPAGRCRSSPSAVSPTGRRGREYSTAGASLVQLYSGFIYGGPGLVRRINQVASGLLARGRGGPHPAGLACAPAGEITEYSRREVPPLGRLPLRDLASACRITGWPSTIRASPRRCRPKRGCPRLRVKSPTPAQRPRRRPHEVGAGCRSTPAPARSARPSSRQAEEHQARRRRPRRGAWCDKARRSSGQKDSTTARQAATDVGRGREDLGRRHHADVLRVARRARRRRERRPAWWRCRWRSARHRCSRQGPGR